MSKTILTVDDAATIRRMVSATLSAAGYQVEEAADGQIALDMLKDRKVDLVIADLNMPNLDGISLTRKLRALPHYRLTPIVLLTTESDPEKKSACRTAGATGWMNKPFSRPQLLGLVEKVLGPAQANRSLQGGA